MAGRAHGREVRFQAGDLPCLGAKADEVIYRVAQEALHNALRHSGGQEVRVTLCRDPAGVALGRGTTVRFRPCRRRPAGWAWPRCATERRRRTLTVAPRRERVRPSGSPAVEGDRADQVPIGRRRPGRAAGTARLPRRPGRHGGRGRGGGRHDRGRARAALAPDVILLDLKMPGLDGVGLGGFGAARGITARALILPARQGQPGRGRDGGRRGGYP